MANVTISVPINTIPAPYRQRMEEAVLEGIGGLPGLWTVTLLADQKNLAYYVAVKHEDGRTWQWRFDGSFEQKPEVVRTRIWNRLRMTIGQALIEKREEILRIASQYGGSNVRVFGSHVNGETRPDSDLDILLVMEPGRSLFDLIGIKQDLEHLLGCQVDVVSEDGLSPYLRDRVLREAVAV